MLSGIDPDDTILENPLLHTAIQQPIDAYAGNEDYDLVTLRMVAEHIEHPKALVRALATALRPGGHVVIYTVNRFSPVPIVTGVVPFRLHNPVKRILWGTESKDMFPTRFRMNTRSTLLHLLNSAGFEEVLFAYLDDCRTFTGFRRLATLELRLWRALRKLGWHYPENCLLGVYRRQVAR